ncbi:serine/threonine-protein phosphatase 6 regulatory ankyrin repeat subunit C-like [Ptychodera flava]|uniref:serine/threonine-protein phosphatase 6 regulatory ankyrin repeat subunit C-like n=1 Tax=Ptychodera flava TaxID=63121 RepID=UPI00396A6897
MKGIQSDMSTVLHQAILAERLHQVRLLVSLGVNIEKKDRLGRTPLMLTCIIDNRDYAYKMFQILLRSGAFPNVRDQYGRTVLNYACLYGRDRMVKRLLREEILEINFTDDNDDTPLNHAATSGNLEIIQLLVRQLTKFGLPVDVRNKQGYTALLLASKHGNYECAHVLLTEGRASVSSRDNERFMNAAEWARESHADFAESVKRRDKTACGFYRPKQAWGQTSSPVSGYQTVPQTPSDYEQSLPPISNATTPRTQTRPNSLLSELRYKQNCLNTFIGSLEARQKSAIASRRSRPPSTVSSMPTPMASNGPEFLAHGKRRRTMVDDLRKLFDIYQEQLSFRPVSTPPDFQATPTRLEISSAMSYSSPLIPIIRETAS